MKMMKTDFESLINRLETAVMVLAGDLTENPGVVFSNGAFAHWVAASVEEIAGQCLAFLFSPKDCDDILLAIKNVRDTSTDQIISLTFSGHDKSHRQIDFMVTPFKFRRGKMVACLLQEIRQGHSVESCLTETVDSIEPSQRQQEQKDEDSGVFNRRYFYEQVERECLRLYRYGSVYTLIGVELLIDDDVKAQVSDWDKKFLSAAQILKDTFRTQDVIGRNQPDQFMVLMPETKLSQALYVAERLKRAFNDNYAKGNGVRVAIGVTEGKVSDQHFSDTLRRVEASLEDSGASHGRKVAYSL